MKKIINYFKSWGMDKWAHFGVGGLVCALSTLIFIFALNPIPVSWMLLLAVIPSTVFVGILSIVKEGTDSTGFSLPDIVAALLGCATVEIAMVIAIAVGLLNA